MAPTRSFGTVRLDGSGSPGSPQIFLLLRNHPEMTLPTRPHATPSTRHAGPGVGRHAAQAVVHRRVYPEAAVAQARQLPERHQNRIKALTWFYQYLTISGLALTVIALVWLALPALKARVEGPAQPSTTTSAMTRPALPATAPDASAAVLPATQPVDPVTQSLQPASDLHERHRHAHQLVTQGRDAEALQAYQQLVEQQPDLTEALNNLGVLQVRAGQLTQARQTFEAALRSSNSHAVAFDNLRQLYGELASRAYAQALQEPWHPADPRERYRTIAELGTSTLPPMTMPTAHGLTETPAATTAGSAPVPAARPGADQPARHLVPETPRSSHAGWLDRALFGQRDSATTDEPPPLPQPPAASAGRLGAALQINAGRIASAMLLIAMLVVLAMAAVQSHAAKPRSSHQTEQGGSDSSPVSTLQQSAEARLIEIYRLIGAAETRQALAHAEALINDSPNFQLAQLVYGDLLLAQGAPLDGFGQGATRLGSSAGAQVSQLQQEAIKRLHALRAAPPLGTVPSAFVQLASTTRHAVAVDATHSRLYVFENRASGLVLASSHYIATGRQGVGKRREGDLRTPLGVYFISGRLDARDLDDFYGVGALPLNYPNEHDRRSGRTGADIWVHGTPTAQHSPPPDSTNGCIVLANDDLRLLWRELTPQNTPVVIARHLDWVTPASLSTQRRELLAVLESWRQARSNGDVPRTLAFHAADYRMSDATPAESRRSVEREIASGAPRERDLREISVLAWQDEGDRAVISFTEYTRGSRKGVMHRQYWNHEQGHWKLYSEGVIE
ncbi:MAG: hypothetical protein RLZZ584_209 [Pseudomonadota bacterium]